MSLRLTLFTALLFLPSLMACQILDPLPFPGNSTLRITESYPNSPQLIPLAKCPVHVIDLSPRDLFLLFSFWIIVWKLTGLIADLSRGFYLVGSDEQEMVEVPKQRRVAPRARAQVVSRNAEEDPKERRTSARIQARIARVEESSDDTTGSPRSRRAAARRRS